MESYHPPEDPLRYRRDVDGIRGLAVGSVVLAHAGFPWAEGGFVGVDVFFVISGFLISEIITGELTSGAFSVTSFYERRARRILPALVVVLLVTTCGVYFWLPAVRILEFGRGMAAAVTFVANIFLWRTSGYFAPTADETPLIHVWSLGVEEQFYLIFPLLVFATWRWKRVYPALVMGGLLLSLVVAEWGSHNSPRAAFYLLPTRAWELLLGAAVAGLRGQLRPVDWPGRSLGLLLGLLAIVLPVTAYGPSTPMPGLLALIPAGGCALLLLLGGEETTLVERILRWPPLAGLGLISYSVYLWHQPLLVFSRYRALNPPEVFEVLLVILACVLLSALTWLLVERPFRKPETIPSRTAVLALGIGVLGVLGLASAIEATEGRGGRVELSESIVLSLRRTTDKNLLCLRDDNSEVPSPFGCRVGPPQKRVAFLVIGDSHAGALFPAFERLAADSSVAGLVVSFSSCLPLLGQTWAVSRRADDCARMNQRAREYVRAERPRIVVLVARWSGPLAPGRRSALPGWYPRAGRAELGRRLENDLRLTAATYREAGAVVVVIPEVVGPRYSPERIYSMIGHDSMPSALIRKAGITLSEYRASHAIEEEIFHRLEHEKLLKLIDLNPALCPDAVCIVGSPSQSYFGDLNHLSDVGALHVGSELIKGFPFREAR